MACNKPTWTHAAAERALAGALLLGLPPHSMHSSILLDSDDTLGAFSPHRGREASTMAELYHQPRTFGLRQPQHQIEEQLEGLRALGVAVFGDAALQPIGRVLAIIHVTGFLFCMF